MKNLIITIFIVSILAFVPFASIRVNLLENNISTLQTENQALELNVIDLQGQISILEENQNNVIIENDLLDIYFGGSPSFLSLNHTIEDNNVTRPTISLPSEIKSIQYQIELTKSQTQNFISLRPTLKFKFWSGLETDYLIVGNGSNNLLQLDEPFDSENNYHFFMGLEFAMKTFFLNMQFDTYDFETKTKLTTYVPLYINMQTDELTSTYADSYLNYYTDYFYNTIYNFITSPIENQIYMNSGISGTIYYNNDIPFNYFVKVNIV